MGNARKLRSHFSSLSNAGEAAPNLGSALGGKLSCADWIPNHLRLLLMALFLGSRSKHLLKACLAR